MLVDPPPYLSSENQGVALITGGLGGLGVVTAEALVEAGVKRVVLASRSGQVKHSDQGLQERLELLRHTRGVEVVIEQCDMGEESQVEAMLGRIRTLLGPLRVVVHAAGVLADALLLKQDLESVRCVFSAKADGAWYLHKHTSGDVLDTFMVYSSISALFGNPGQANYAAANAYLDELVRHRVASGWPGVSVQWPGIMGVGMAAAMDERVRVDASASVDVSTVKQVLHQLWACRDAQHVAGNPVQAVVPRMVLEESVVLSNASLLSNVKVGGRTVVRW